MTKKECTKHRYETIYKPAYDALMKVYPFTTDDLDGELWKEFNGYQISNFGRVKSYTAFPNLLSLTSFMN